MQKDIIKQEHDRLYDLLKRAGVAKQKIEALEVVINNMSWQRAKLEETMKLIKNSAVAIPYDNGGGQTGIRENPLYKGYLNLWRGYMVGLEKFTSCLPEELMEEASNGAVTALDKVIQMKQKKVR